MPLKKHKKNRNNKKDNKRTRKNKNTKRKNMKGGDMFLLLALNSIAMIIIAICMIIILIILLLAKIFGWGVPMPPDESGSKSGSIDTVPVPGSYSDKIEKMRSNNNIRHTDTEQYKNSYESKDTYRSRDTDTSISLSNKKTREKEQININTQRQKEQSKNLIDNKYQLKIDKKKRELQQASNPYSREKKQRALNNIIKKKQSEMEKRERQFNISANKLKQRRENEFNKQFKIETKQAKKEQDRIDRQKRYNQGQRTYSNQIRAGLGYDKNIDRTLKPGEKIKQKENELYGKKGYLWRGKSKTEKEQNRINRQTRYNEGRRTYSNQIRAGLGYDKNINRSLKPGEKIKQRTNPKGYELTQQQEISQPQEISQSRQMSLPQSRQMSPPQSQEISLPQPQHQPQPQPQPQP